MDLVPSYLTSCTHLRRFMIRLTGVLIYIKVMYINNVEA